jgi:y4mF family transcriptional regulator
MTQTCADTIGGFVRHRRKAVGLTQRELGELAGVGQRFVSELERDKPTVRVDAVNKVLAVFGKRLGLVDNPREEEIDALGEGDAL